MTKLYIDGIEFDVYMQSITERDKGVLEKAPYYREEPFVSLAYPDSRHVTLVFTIYDINRKEIAKDMKDLLRSREQFFMWLDGRDIIDGYAYIVATCETIRTPDDAESPEVIRVTMNVKVLSVYDNNTCENNYVSVTYLGNVWDLEGSS